MAYNHSPKSKQIHSSDDFPLILAAFEDHLKYWLHKEIERVVNQKLENLEAENKENLEAENKSLRDQNLELRQMVDPYSADCRSVQDFLEEE